MSDDERAVFLVSLASGLPVDAASRMCGRAMGSLYALRRSDKAFRAEWDDALDASVAEIDERLRIIGMQGSMESMATVRALEVLRRGRSSTERRDLALTMKQTDEEGRVREITVRALAPTPD